MLHYTLYNVLKADIYIQTQTQTGRQTYKRTCWQI